MPRGWLYFWSIFLSILFIFITVSGLRYLLKNLQSSPDAEQKPATKKAK